MRKISTKWHAVTVVLHEASCAAAAMCRNTRYLADEAPRLPLAKCPCPNQCPCTYRHFEDRRTMPRRTADVGGALDSSKPAANRRQARGRRSTDQR